MKRHKITPRADRAEKLESIGFSFHALDDYWAEDRCYSFTEKEIEVIETATEELHGLCLNAVDYVIKNEMLGKLGIPELYWNAIESSWKNEEKSLYGRFDLAYDGKLPPKMMEYNADTPTSILETGVAQWTWLEDVYPDKDQFNSLHDKLVARWKEIASGKIHLASLKDNEEDWVAIMYLLDTATQAGLECERIDIEDIGYNYGFVDLNDKPIETLFKLYPWEWIMREDFGPKILDSKTKFIEPIWKSVLSCKGILPILWERNKNHPNLLPAYFNGPNLMWSYVKKPLYSREGANVEIYNGFSKTHSSSGIYGAEGHIYQEKFKIPELDGYYPIIGSWIVGNEAAGIDIREDVTPITTNMSAFVPHYIE